MSKTRSAPPLMVVSILPGHLLVTIMGSSPSTVFSVRLHEEGRLAAATAPKSITERPPMIWSLRILSLAFGLLARMSKSFSRSQGLHG